MEASAPKRTGVGDSWPTGSDARGVSLKPPEGNGLTEADFVRLAKAFFAEIGAKFGK
jgi:hypothetical protein